MPARRPSSYSPAAREAARILGGRIKVARLERRWSLEELARRVGVSRITIAKVETGNLTVQLGIAFEAAALLGVPLVVEERRPSELQLVREQLANLPVNARRPRRVDDDF
jgi:transcriptional regulator with XRE-family HTH domain